MRPTGLEIARESARFELLEALYGLGGSDDVRLLVEITARYHVLGVTALLEDADRAAFAFLLALSGQTHAHLLSLDLSNHPRERAPSRALAFADSLAAGDLGTARLIAARAVQRHVEGYEYEDDFLELHVMHKLVLDPTADQPLEALLARWSEVLDGATSPRLDVARAIVRRDETAFDDAMSSLSADRQRRLARWRTTPLFREDVAATEAHVFVHGLALLRIAESRGLRTAPEYPFMPEIARVPLGLPLPGGDDWLKGEPSATSP